MLILLSGISLVPKRTRIRFTPISRYAETRAYYDNLKYKLQYTFIVVCL